MSIPDHWDIEDGISNEIWRENGFYSYYESEDAGTLYFNPYFDEWVSYFQNLTFDVEGSLDEEIQSFEADDGQFVMTTLPGAENAAKYLEQYRDGVVVTLVYWLDAEMLTLRSFVRTITCTDGSNDTLQAEYLYDVPLPDEAQALLERLDDPQQLWTVTLNPDTEEELTRSAVMCKGENTRVMLDDAQTCCWYLDRERTQVYDGSDTNEDLHVYLKKN